MPSCQIKYLETKPFGMSALQKYRNLSLTRSLIRLLCKLQKKDYLLINVFQIGSGKMYFIIKSYWEALVVEQEKLL